MSEDESVRPEHATPPTPEAAPLLVQARGLEMAGRESMVFGPLDFDIPQGNIGVLTGQQGSGRSALLLALSGRLKGVKGHLVINGEDAMSKTRQLRKHISVGRISGLAELEPNLTVGESRDERAIADGLGQRKGRDRFRLLEEVLGHYFQLDQWVDHMPAVERTLLTVVLGSLVPSTHVVIDDLDDSLTAEQLAFIYDAMLAIQQADGRDFIVSALDQNAIPANATCVHLASPAPRTPPDLLPSSIIRRNANREAN